MAETIKGINVVIGAETTGLGKALSDVNKQSRSIQSELRKVKKGLKFDSSSTTLLAQKQQLLGKNIENTKEKLQKLKDAEEQVNEQFSNGKISEGQYRAFQREIETTKNKLKNLEGQLKKTSPALQSFGAKAAEAGKKLNKIGSGISGAGKSLSLGVTVPLLGAAAASVKVGNDFEAEMDKVQAISGSTGEDFSKLKAKAEEMGSKTKFSATESAQGLEYMAMAGWKTQDMLDGLPPVLNLAIASGEELGTTSDIVTDALTAFGLKAKDSGMFTDVLAAASSNANTNIGMMGQTFQYAAPVAGALGYSVQDTAIAIGLMANAGIKAEKAGTALRTGMTNLAKPTKKMRKSMEKYKISLTDTNGEVKPFRQLIGELREKLGGLDKATQAQVVSTIFGKEAMSGWLAVINASPKDLNKLTTAIDKSEGATQKMADTMSDNAKGSIAEMKSALESAAIKIQEVLAPAITSIAKAIGNLAAKFSALSPATQKIILIVAGIAAAIGPLLIIIGKIITVIGTVAGAIGVVTAGAAAATPAVAGLAAVFTVLTGPIGIVLGIITAVAATAFLIVKNWTPIKTFFIGIWNSIVVAFKGIKASIEGTWNSITTTTNNVWNTIVSSLTGFVNGIKNTISSAFISITSFFTTVWNTISNIFNTVINAIVNTAQGLWGTFGKSIMTIFNGIEKFFTGIWKSIKAIFLGTVLLIVDLVTGNFEQLSDDAQLILEDLQDAFSDIWNGIKEVFSGALDFIKNYISTVWNGIKAITETVWNGLKAFLSNLWNGIKFLAFNAWNGLKNIVINFCINIKNNAVNIFNALLNFFKTLPSKLRSIGSSMFSSMRNGVNSTINTVVSAIKNGIGNAISWLKSLPRQAVEWGSDMVSGFARGVKNAMHRVLDEVRSLARKIRSYLHFSRPDAGPLHDYESWMPDFMGGLAEGINKNKRLVENAIQSLSTDMSVGVKYNAIPQADTANSNNFKGIKNNDLIIKIENMNVRKKSDIKAIAQELEFYREQNNLAKGGAY